MLKKNSILTNRQKEVLRYRRDGLAQWQVAQLLNVSESAISVVERAAKKNIRLAKKTLDAFYTMDARFFCTIKEGANLFEAIVMIADEANKAGFTITADPVELVRQLRTENPECINGQAVRGYIKVFIRDNGLVYFECFYE
ncbi:Tfx family DNA-binding protein [Methanoregula sp.]|uniref:Tfx family DNA-binding protein n=1 Tax=Methanoregula sp. TaxID=2052170 RepID=UPI0026224E39|nr:Tfx family DNA-binding protein [Methanoregula sp.]MDD5142502.1 Tfx family DNA-binding protein [Methanoregula sp.]